MHGENLGATGNKQFGNLAIWQCDNEAMRQWEGNGKEKLKAAPLGEEVKKGREGASLNVFSLRYCLCCPRALRLLARKKIIEQRNNRTDEQ